MSRFWDRYDADESRFDEIISLAHSDPSSITLEKGPPWQRYVDYSRGSVVNPFTGEVEEVRTGSAPNPDYDPGLVDRVAKARRKIESKARRGVFRSGIFKTGSHEPPYVQEILILPTIDGGTEAELHTFDNPEVQATNRWVWLTQEINRDKIRSFRKSMPDEDITMDFSYIDPTEQGFSYYRTIKVRSPYLSKLTSTVKNQLGKAIVKRREEAKKANKIVFEFPDTQVAHKYPATYYRPKFMKLFNTFSKGTYMPKFVAEAYILDTKGRWPKRDGHSVVPIGNLKEHSKWGETLVVQDLDVGDKLRVNIKYILPPEDKILKWE